MSDFPPFMRHRANRIASGSQHTRGIEGYVFDGADGSQMAFWTVTKDAHTVEHVHPFDEYVLVVEGTYRMTLDGKEVRLEAGQEYTIHAGTRIAGHVSAGTRTIHAFGGARAMREKPAGG
jgi:quercetin dioxygenase-like cupin family protein